MIITAEALDFQGLSRAFRLTPKHRNDKHKCPSLHAPGCQPVPPNNERTIFMGDHRVPALPHIPATGLALIVGLFLFPPRALPQG